MHPKIYGGILDNIRIPTDDYKFVDLVVVNLYPFEQSPSIENIDIGGVSLIRAGAKNYEYVDVLTNPTQYEQYIQGNFTSKILAYEAFQYITRYDNAITECFKTNTI